ncbi:MULTISPECIES: peroxiredoxin [unclassified Leifsonia]|uniref:peroxiredoxin n=1 Tax=unclassified Leifsonia TaxID=2663824 RepID=UPI0006F61569|nr:MULTISPECIES: peroxiredoxin [unclassified Leifsonia]KQX07050.1 peroxiredoxin [Leifsonia sp. Root1293]KRA11333.1 peroxiredoxin [Leifsonia sp. Root60]
MSVQVGDIAPGFSLVNQYGADVSLEALRGRKAVALVFFPLAFSRTCSGELCELRDNLSIFAAEGVELLGISVDSKHTLRAWAEAEGFGFDLLADFWPHGAVASSYGVFLPERGYAGRATFLIDAEGIVRARFESEPGEPRPLAAYRQALTALTR